MRICLISHSFYPATCYGGPIFSTYELCKEIARLGFSVYVSTTNANGSSQDSYSFNLFVESDYPVKTGSASDLANEPACLDEDAELGCDNCVDADDDLQCDGDGVATRSDDTDISLSVSPEPNDGSSIFGLNLTRHFT